MKKILCLVISVIIVLTFVYQYVARKYLSDNQKYDIGIREITIMEPEDEEKLCDDLFSLFSHEKKNGWSEELKKAIHNDVDAYRIVAIKYIVKNNSKNILMQRIKFKPKFQKELKLNIKAFNVDHSTYILSAAPGTTSGLVQYIVVKKDNMSDEDIYQKILESEVRLSWNAGIQKNEYETWANVGQQKNFKVDDALNNYKNNPELFE